MTRIEFEGDLSRVAGSRPFVGGPGRLFEIRSEKLVPIELPQPDGIPLAIDAEGRLILARTSGDRAVRRYREGKLDATYGFKLGDLLSLAVSGNDLVVAFRSGLVQRIDERTVPRIDYSRRLGLDAGPVDARGDRIAMAGKKSVIFNHEGVVLENVGSADRVRLRKEGSWAVGEGLRSGNRTLLPADLGLNRMHDVLCGGDSEWALGEALVRVDS